MTIKEILEMLECDGYPHQNYGVNEALSSIHEEIKKELLDKEELSDILAKALYFTMGCHYEVDAKYYADVIDILLTKKLSTLFGKGE